MWQRGWPRDLNYYKPWFGPLGTLFFKKLTVRKSVRFTKFCTLGIIYDLSAKIGKYDRILYSLGVLKKISSKLRCFACRKGCLLTLRMLAGRPI